MQAVGQHALQTQRVGIQTLRTAVGIVGVIIHEITQHAVEAIHLRGGIKLGANVGGIVSAKSQVAVTRHKSPLAVGDLNALNGLTRVTPKLDVVVRPVVIGGEQIQRTILCKAVQIHKRCQGIIIGHIALLLRGGYLIADCFPSRQLLGVVAVVIEPIAVKAAAARGVQLALDDDHVVVVHTVHALDVILVHILFHVKDAVIFAVDIHHRKGGACIVQRIGHACGKIIDRIVAQERRLGRVAGIMQERIVAAVTQDQTVVSVQHLACILAVAHRALLEECIAERALALVNIRAVISRFAGNDLKGLLRQGSRRAAKDPHAAVLRDHGLAVGGDDLDVRGHLQFFRIVEAKLVKIIGIQRQRYGIQRRGGFRTDDIAVGYHATHDIAVRIKAGRTDHACLALGGHAHAVGHRIRLFGRNRAVGGIAHGQLRPLGGGNFQRLCLGIYAARDREHGIGQILRRGRIGNLLGVGSGRALLRCINHGGIRTVAGRQRTQQQNAQKQNGYGFLHKTSPFVY